MTHPYKEGTWFGVTVEDGGYAVGLVARAKPRGRAVLGYFFGPRLSALPRDTELEHLSPKGAVLVARFSDLYLRHGRWPLIGSVEGWDRKKWPMPAFQRIELFTNRVVVSYYDDNDPAKFLGEEEGDPTDNLPSDAQWGAGSVEKWLNVTFDPEPGDKGLNDPTVMNAWEADAFVVRKGGVVPVHVAISAPSPSSDGYVCELIVSPLINRPMRFPATNPMRAKRNAITAAHVLISERKLVNATGDALVVPSV
jgi:hypothetical protein